MAKKTEVAKLEEKDAAVALLESTDETGLEGTTQDDYALPFLKLLQKMSPEVDEDSGSYIQGAKPGMFMDSSTRELFETVDVIPCLYRHAMVEWAGDEPGSGFVAQHDPGYEKQFDRHVKNGRETGRWVTPSGHIIQDTRYFFCLRVTDDGDFYPIIVSMTSTQIKKSKNWMSALGALRRTNDEGARVPVPLWGGMWKLSSVSEENDLGSFKGYKVELAKILTGSENAPLVRAAMEARSMFKSAATSVKPPTEGAKSGSTDDEIPF